VTRFAALALASALAGCAAIAAHQAERADFGHALTPVFELDMPSALARLAAIPERALNPQQRAVRACMQSRFGGSAVGGGPLTGLPGDVLRAYRLYWTASLLRQQGPEQAESTLLAELDRLSGAATSLDVDARLDGPARVARLLEAQGLFVLGGVTPPLRELMLWRQQTTTLTTVELPGGPIEVAVAMLDDFLSLGWAAWATCERSHTGGWATADGIMVVRAAWDLNGEAYRVSLLAHEAQHFSDLRRYPKLSSADLEYRAKLVELALAHDTQAALMEYFSIQARRDRTLPHQFASYWVVERLRSRTERQPWTGHFGSAVRQAALAELAAHSALLDERGAESVTTALPD
jgi:hypothetical protein